MVEAMSSGETLHLASFELWVLWDLFHRVNMLQVHRVQTLIGCVKCESFQMKTTFVTSCLCWIRFPSKLSCGYHSRTCQILRLYGEQSCLVWHMCQCPFSPFLLASANNVNGFELVKIGNCQRPDIPYNLNNQWQPHQQLYPLEHSEPQNSSMSNSVSSKPGLV